MRLQVQHDNTISAVSSRCFNDTRIVLGQRTSRCASEACDACEEPCAARIPPSPASLQCRGRVVVVTPPLHACVCYTPFRDLSFVLFLPGVFKV